MAKITCAISNLKLDCTDFNSLVVPSTEGYIHPIFAASEYSLNKLYSKHCRGELTNRESFLLFLAYIHHTCKVTWKHPIKSLPESKATIKIIESNLHRLVTVINKSDAILHPRFEQPSFIVHANNCHLDQVANWIKAMEQNIKLFYSKRATDDDLERLKKVENKLTYLIMSGDSPESFSRVIADWADKVAEFPDNKRQLWKDTITSCFSITKMFNTPLAVLEELKDYVECNIEVGTIHFHTLSEVIAAGIAKHKDYLGGSSLALGYSLLPSLDGSFEVPELKGKLPKNSAAEDKSLERLAAIIADAPTKLPVRADYISTTDFIKAKLAYRTAATARAQAKELQAKLDKPTEFKSASPVPEQDPNLPEQAELDEEDYVLDTDDLLDSGLTIIESYEE